MEEQLTLELVMPPDPKLPDLWTVDEIFNKLNEKIIEAFSEDHRVERKRATIENRDLGDSVCMFANRAPEGGLILIGVENDGKITGCKDVSTEKLNSYEQARSTFCPDATAEFNRVQVIDYLGDENFIIAVRVYYHERKLIETSKGEAFLREGSAKRRLTDSEKREIRINRGEIDFEQEPVDLDYPSDFDVDLIDEFCQSYRGKRALSSQHTNEQILKINHLGNIKSGQFIPNNACTLLFAINPTAIFAGARIRFLKFDGNEEGLGAKFNVVKDAWIDGPLPKLISEADKTVDAQMRNFTRLGKNNKFYTRPEYPREAWIEAIVNAVVHRSYNYRTMQIFIKMFDDRFVVESPGGFVPPTNSKNIYQSHNPRNPRLMQALFYFDWVKCAHEGTRRMKETMNSAELPAPEFLQKDVSGHQVHVTLRNDVEHRKVFLDTDAVRVLGEAAFGSLSDQERAVINFLAERHRISVSDANRLLGKDWHSAKAILEDLKKRGILERRGKSNKEKDGSKRYYLAKK